jgi:hypothetical protein
MSIPAVCANRGEIKPGNRVEIRAVRPKWVTVEGGGLSMGYAEFALAA